MLAKHGPSGLTTLQLHCTLNWQIWPMNLLYTNNSTGCLDTWRHLARAAIQSIQHWETIWTTGAILAICICTPKHMGVQNVDCWSNSGCCVCREVCCAVVTNRHTLIKNYHALVLSHRQFWASEYVFPLFKYTWLRATEIFCGFSIPFREYIHKYSWNYWILQYKIIQGSLLRDNLHFFKMVCVSKMLYSLEI